MAKLYIVGTPIGNLKDMTFRAVETLKAADVIACEDTRHSLPLLAHYEIKAKLVSYHKHNEIERSSEIIDMVRQGLNVALITDAGMPSVSDPGAELVSMCREQGVDIEIVPGPTAVASAVALSGVKANGFVFLGFLPEKRTAREAVVSKASLSGLPIVIYIAPHDAVKTAAELSKLLGDRRVFVCREMTKLYESVTVTSLANFGCEERGEMVFVIEGASSENVLNELTVAEHLKHYISLGMDKKEAVKKVASDRGIAKNDVYQQAIDI